MLLVGGAVTARVVAPGLVERRGLRLVRAGLVIGALLLMGAALLEVAVTLKAALGRVDVDLFRRYLTSTRHGEMARLRLAVAPAAALVGVVLTLPSLRTDGTRIARRVGTVVLLVLCAELLYTFAILSHAAAMGGRAPLVADLVHLAAAALWAGPVLYLAAIGGFGRRPEAPEGVAAVGGGASETTVGSRTRSDSLAPRDSLTSAQRAARRVSRIGMVAVPVLLLTGAFNALTHASDPAGFARSAYGWSLWVKLGLFALILMVAAANLLAFLPRFLREGDGRALLRSMRLESVLLIATFVVTGALTTSALPHGADVSTDVLENLRRALEQLRP